EKNEDKNCPALTNPSSDFCKQGKIKLERGDNGCVMKIGCILPESITSEKECKTNNDCCAEINPSTGQAGLCYGKCINGKCIKPEVSCKKLWWFDNQNKTCQQKEFCGAYMYLGLKTFSEPEECKRNLNQNTNSLTPQVNQ
ncbi:MAG: hypothetical protein Q8O66_00855, partial [bacterium]|nr:hypothetical protein [bacterium]